MGKRYLEIIAELKESITDKADKMERALDRVDRQITKMAGNWKRFGRDMQQVGNQIALAGAAITGPMLLAFNNSAQYSRRVSDQIDNLKNVTNQFQLSIANALVPIMERFNNILGNILAKWNALDSAVREQIVHTVFMTGVYLTMSGILVGLTGRVIKFGGEVVLLTMKFVGFARVHPILMAITAAIIWMIFNWEKLRDVAIPIMNAIELSVSTLAIGFEKLAASVGTVVANLAGSMAKLYELMAKIPGPQTHLYSAMADGLRDVESHLIDVVESRNELVRDMEKNVANILNSGKGAMASVVDSGILEARRLKKILDEILNKEVKTDGVVKAYDAMKDMTSRTAQSMSNTMGDLFFNTMTGKFKNLRDVAANFGQDMLRIISQVLAKMFLIKIFGGATIGGNVISNFFHDGGMIHRAHDGMLAHDEVPIIAQTGEAILSRRGVRAIGTENIYRANSGFGPSSGGSAMASGPVTYVIQAVDAQSFEQMLSKNRAVIHQLVTSNLERGGKLRSAIKMHG